MSGDCKIEFNIGSNMNALTSVQKKGIGSAVAKECKEGGGELSVEMYSADRTDCYVRKADGKTFCPYSYTTYTFRVTNPKKGMETVYVGSHNCKGKGFHCVNRAINSLFRALNPQTKKKIGK